MTDDPTPEQIQALIVGNAETFVRFFREELQGPTLDFSRASLDDVDAFLGALHQVGQQLPDNIHGLAAAYLNEVARREYGGEYVAGDDANPYRLAVGDPPAVLLHAHQKIAGRVANGAEDSIPFYYDGIAGGLASPGLTMLI